MKFTIIPINRKSFGSTLHYPWPLTSESMTEPVLSLLASPQALPPALLGCVGTNGTPVGVARPIAADDDVRSEEHKSEIQSPKRIPSAVFCLQKKIIIKN